MRARISCAELRAVCLAEGLPGERTWERVCVGKYAAANYEVPRGVELEQEQFSGLQRPEVSRRRRPEIDLAKVRLPTQHVKPVVYR